MVLWLSSSAATQASPEQWNSSLPCANRIYIKQRTALVAKFRGHREGVGWRFPFSLGQHLGQAECAEDSLWLPSFMSVSDPTPTAVNNLWLLGWVFCQTSKSNANEFKPYWGYTTIIIQYIPMQCCAQKKKKKKANIYLRFIFLNQKLFEATLQKCCYIC